MAGEGGWGVPKPRALPKKLEQALGAVVQAVVLDLTQLLGHAASAHMFDKSGVVEKQVIRGELRALAHVPAETHLVVLDPVVGETLEEASVLRLGAQLARRRSGSAGLVGDDGSGGCEGGDETGPVLGALQVLLKERPVVPF